MESGEVSPANCVAAGSGTKKAVCGQPAKFKIKILDKFNNPVVSFSDSSAIQAYLMLSDQAATGPAIKCDIEQHGDAVFLGTSLILSTLCDECLTLCREVLPGEERQISVVCEDTWQRRQGEPRNAQSGCREDGAATYPHQGTGLCRCRGCVFGESVLIRQLSQPYQGKTTVLQIMVGISLSDYL